MIDYPMFLFELISPNDFSCLLISALPPGKDFCLNEKANSDKQSYEKKLSSFDTEDGKVKKKSSEYWDKFNSIAKKYNLDPDKLQTIARSSESQDDIKSNLEALKVDPVKYAEFLDDFVGEGKNITGKHTGKNIVGPKITDANSIFSKNLEEDELSRNELREKQQKEYDNLISSPPEGYEVDPLSGYEEIDGTGYGGGFMNSGKDPSEIFLKKGNVLDDIPYDQLPGDLQQAADEAGGNLNINMSTSSSEDKQETDASGDFWDTLGKNNPLKYSSAMTNMMMGLSPAERVTRRQASGDFYDYEDFSNTARQENIENRNFMMRQMKNRVDRSGSLGTAGQIQSRYLGQSEAINENEARRRFAVEQQNKALSNQLRQTNLQIARQDDDKDAANRAAKQKFASTAAAEISELAQYDEQKSLSYWSRRSRNVCSC